MGGVQRQIAIAALLEDLVHEPSAASLGLCAGRRDHQADGGKVVPVRKPHRAPENTSDSVNGNNTVAGATQEPAVLRSMRPTDRDRQRVQQFDVDVVDVPREQFEGFQAH